MELYIYSLFLFILSITSCSSLTEIKHESTATENREILQQVNILAEKYKILEKNNQILQKKVETLETALQQELNIRAKADEIYQSRIDNLNDKQEEQLAWNAKIELSTQNESNNFLRLEEICLNSMKLITDKPIHTKRQQEEQEPIAFYAGLSNKVTYGYGENIIFDNVTLNLGTNYIRSHGIFVAPVAGVYVFSTTLMTEYGTDTHAAIYVNENLATWIKLYGSEHQYDTMSQTAIYQLNKGDAVAVKHTETSKTLHGNYTYFSGFLLHEIYQTYSNTIVG